MNILHDLNMVCGICIPYESCMVLIFEDWYALGWYKGNMLYDFSENNKTRNKQKCALFQKIYFIYYDITYSCGQHKFIKWKWTCCQSLTYQTLEKSEIVAYPYCDYVTNLALCSIHISCRTVLLLFFRQNKWCIFTVCTS